MPYDKVIVSPSGAEFPYSDLSDEESYYYEISVVFDDRDGELRILIYVNTDSGQYEHPAFPALGSVLF